MATTLAQKNSLAIDATFIAQVKMQILAEAITRLSDSKTGADSGYKKIIQLANSIISSPDSYASTFACAIAANSQLASPVADASVVTAVTQAFPIVAGINKYEL